ncbi:uncharacterized protein (TIGR02217 family) [Novosphingobium kunmingense]|uniref:Uncharacterized protein (TIGR02217 family) n=1 Tax=Novosphingobium kunmingense TaxID=1211806 RepID=A0A2N0HL23_9SPHN|nr:DUF2460 domain-containing protein [Novosphingobium kunmingense]PKB19661.1 uncharacterized protein (TIGR02217 family) [Novosphingobium kunmingense]
MTGFVDEYMPDKVPGFPCTAAPRFNTSIKVAAGGGEKRNQEWEQPLHRYGLPEAQGRDPDVVEALRQHWLTMRGPYFSWPWADPFDKASLDLAHPNESDDDVLARIAATDQLIGTGDGLAERFRLSKLYTYGSGSYRRTVHLPVLASVVVAVDGVEADPGDYTVSRPGGVIEFAVAPADGAAITAGFLFDVEVRFEGDDAFEAILRGGDVGGFAGLSLIEVRPC